MGRGVGLHQVRTKTHCSWAIFATHGTKEAIKQKLKDYGINGVENINLVEDPQHEGLSRGFAFVEFSCHAKAMFAYKRLQKPDVVFGHSDRTAKVAFAEPLPEPDPGVMALVKSVFVDGLPPHWDEDCVRKEFKRYGDLDRITLARNMLNAKRKDFGFVDFTTHEAAVACIDDINTRGLGDGNSKERVLDEVDILTSVSKIFNAIGVSINMEVLKLVEWVLLTNVTLIAHILLPMAWKVFKEIRRWGPTVPARHALDRFRHGDTDRGSGRHMPWRGQPVFPEEEFNRPFLGRQFDDPYRYDGSVHGIKRRNFTGQHSDYMEPSRVRARYDYSDPAFSRRGTRYRGLDFMFIIALVQYVDSKGFTMTKGSVGFVIAVTKRLINYVSIRLPKISCEKFVTKVKS
ncbi:hypothetical protein LguiB_033048 [Lonicera macranthoides]